MKIWLKRSLSNLMWSLYCNLFGYYVAFSYPNQIWFAFTYGRTLFSGEYGGGWSSTYSKVGHTDQIIMLRWKTWFESIQFCAFRDNPLEKVLISFRKSLHGNVGYQIVVCNFHTSYFASLSSTNGILENIQCRPIKIWICQRVHPIWSLSLIFCKWIFYCR